MYESEDKKIKYWRCSEDDVLPYLDEAVTVTNGDVSAGTFGSGFSDHLRLANVSVRGKNDEFISSLSVSLI